MLLPLVAPSASSTVDLLGRVTAVVHEDGTTSAYAYDMLSRVISRSGVGLAESWSYDASGRPAAAARGGVALAWAYDAFGRVSTETRDGRPWGSHGLLVQQNPMLCWGGLRILGCRRR